MSKMAQGQPKIPKFLSTHPENADRQERLRSHMDEVVSAFLVSDKQAIAKGVEAGCGDGYSDFSRRFRDGMW
jgi:hypothetical protein